MRAAAAGGATAAGAGALAGVPGGGARGVLADAEVRSVRSWTMSAEVADVFASGRAWQIHPTTSSTTF